MSAKGFWGGMSGGGGDRGGEGRGEGVDSRSVGEEVRFSGWKGVVEDLLEADLAVVVDVGLEVNEVPPWWDEGEGRSVDWGEEGGVSIKSQSGGRSAGEKRLKGDWE